MERPSPDYDIAAVVALANNLGLGRIDPTVLKLAHHTTLRLSPLSIVARVQSSGPVDQAAAAMGQELALAQYLADVGAPTVAPIADPPPGPHILGRSATTLWSYVEHRPSRGGKDLTEAAEALRSIHEALLGFKGDLPPFTDNIDRCGSLLADLTAMPMIAPADRAFLEAELCSLRKGLASFSFRAVPLHGDTHIGNVLFASRGPIWADLETACIGPLEWDLVQLPPKTRALFGDVDPILLDHLADLRSVTVAAWCWADATRSEEVRNAAEYHLRRLRRRARTAAARR
jgi:hypothetical protein